MTFDLYRFLRRLRRAQRHPDWVVQLFDGAEPFVQTFNQSEKNTRTVKLLRYRHCLSSYCAELERLGLLYRSGHFGRMNLTQPGWDYLRLTIQGVFRITFLDMLIPIIVAWITARLVAG